MIAIRKSRCRCACSRGSWLAASPLEGQAGLGAVQSLDLAFFVHTQHQSVLGRAQIEADDIFQFLNEGGVVTDFETLHAMRLKTVTAPDMAHAGGADPHCGGHGTRAPVRGLRRGFACRHADHALDQAGADAGPATGTGRIFLQPHQAQSEAPAPARNFFGRDAESLGNVLIRLSRSGTQFTMRARSTPRAGNDRLRARRSQAARCSGFKVTAGAMRIRSRLLPIRRESIHNGCYL